MKRLLPLLLATAFACTSSTPSPTAPPARPATPAVTAPTPAAPAPPLAASPLATPVHVVIVGTTDVHGWFNGHDEVAADKTTQVHFGGLSTFSAYLDALRAANDGRVIVVDSGDLFQGPPESDLFEGDPV